MAIEATVEATMPVVVETVATAETEPIDKHELTMELDDTHLCLIVGIIYT